MTTLIQGNVLGGGHRLTTDDPQVVELLTAIAAGQDPAAAGRKVGDQWVVNPTPPSRAERQGLNSRVWLIDDPCRRQVEELLAS